jgi:hypothetical protein
MKFGVNRSGNDVLLSHSGNNGDSVQGIEEYTPQLSSQASLPVLGTTYPALKKKPRETGLSEIGGPILIDKRSPNLHSSHSILSALNSK